MYVIWVEGLIDVIWVEGLLIGWRVLCMLFGWRVSCMLFGCRVSCVYLRLGIHCVLSKILTRRLHLPAKGAFLLETQSEYRLVSSKVAVLSRHLQTCPPCCLTQTRLHYHPCANFLAPTAWRGGVSRSGCNQLVI